MYHIRPKRASMGEVVRPHMQEPDCAMLYKSENVELNPICDMESVKRLKNRDCLLVFLLSLNMFYDTH